MTPREVYDLYRQMPDQDMYHYAPFLREHGRGNILEIGVRDGVSTSAFLLGLEVNGGHLYSLDINESCGKIFVHPDWTFIHAHSTDDYARVQQIIAGAKPLDILLLDGDHSYGQLATDLRLYTRLLRRGGMLLVHDVQPDDPRKVKDWYPVQECSRAWQDFIGWKSNWLSYIIPGHTGMGVAIKA